MEELVKENEKTVKENFSSGDEIFFTKRRKFDAAYSYCYNFLETMQKNLHLEYEKVNNENRVLWNIFISNYSKLNEYYNAQNEKMYRDRDTLQYSPSEFAKIINESMRYVDILYLVKPTSFDFKYDDANRLIESTFKQILEERKSCHAVQ